MNLVIFDIDGTLLLSGGAGKIAFNKVFETLFNEKEIWHQIIPDGRTDYSLINECFEKRFKRLPTPIETKSVMDLYFKIMPEELERSKRFRLMPHVTETLDILSKSDNIHLGIATGNFKTTAFQKLKRGNLDHFFSYGGFGCDSIDRIELTRKAIQEGTKSVGMPVAKSFVIGDTIHDVNCGKASGAITIAVSSGSTPFETLEALNPDYTINNLSELPMELILNP